jgi:hypothetical protein
MRYLKSFNESIQSKEDIILTVKDILLEFEDIGCKVIVEDITKKISIEIDRKFQYIKLNEYKDTFGHLFSYLNEKGYKMEDNRSHVVNDTWDNRTICTNCGSDRISISNMSSNVAHCDKCSFTDQLQNFVESYIHPISLDDLLFFIKNKYWVQYIYLSFKGDILYKV